MKDFQSRIIEWATTENHIRAVVITGSTARTDGSTDEWSDLDVQLITDDHRRYTASGDWLNNIGRVWVFLPLELAPDVPTRLVWFEGGKKVDFSFWSVAGIQQMIETGQLSDEYQRGYIVALDKDGLFERLPPSPRTFPKPAKPSQEEFEFIVSEFWFEAIHVAQFIRRREMWVVKYRDWTMKQDLLQMMEWHAQALSNWQRNTWIIGKRIKEWVDPETWQALPEIWGQFDAANSWRALFAMIALFDRLAAETAGRLSYLYNKEMYAEIVRYIEVSHDADEPH